MRKAILTWCLMIGLPLTGYFQDRSRNDHSLERAVAIYTSGDLESAVEAFERVIAEDPNNAKAFYDLGTMYFQLGDSGKALAAMRRAVSIDPRYPEAYNQLGVIYLTEGDLKNATVSLQRSVDLSPHDATALYNLGCAYLRSGEFNSARQVLGQANKIDKNNPEIKLNLATALVLAKNDREAIIELRSLVASFPNDIEAQTLLTKLYLRANDRQSALNQYSKLKLVEPKLADIVYSIIYALNVVDVSIQPSARHF